MKKTHPISPAYSKRPDPREPWRYACPICEVVTIQTNTGQPSVPPEPRGRYLCRGCSAGLDRVVDKKTGELVAP